MQIISPLTDRELEVGGILYLTCLTSLQGKESWDINAAFLSALLYCKNENFQPEEENEDKNRPTASSQKPIQSISCLC